MLPADRQKSFWLRGDLAEQLDRHIEERRKATGRRVTERSVLNAAIDAFLNPKPAPAGSRTIDIAPRVKG